MPFWKDMGHGNIIYQKTFKITWFMTGLDLKKW
jgi:hypothetical protein